MRVFRAIIERDIILAFRNGGGAWQAIVFFALTVLVFSLAIGPDLALLSRLAPPILWTCALLSTLVSLDRVFQADFEDGALDVLIETSDFLLISFLAKAVAHWISSCLPLILVTPALGLLLGLNGEDYWPLMISLFVGTPALSLIGAFGAALTLSMRRANMLVTILIAPLFTPVIIFGVSAAQSAGIDSPAFAPSLMILAAITLFAAIFTPPAGAAAIRFNLA